MIYSAIELLALAENFESLATEGLFVEGKKKETKEQDPKAKIRNRGKVIFPAESSKVKDNKDHFPFNDADQARNALARASQYNKVPDWFKGSLKELVETVARKVKKEYSSIEVSKASRTPGKD